MENQETRRIRKSKLKRKSCMRRNEESLIPGPSPREKGAGLWFQKYLC